MKEIKWGIIGSGKIAGRWASDFPLVRNAKLAGVAARNLPKAQEFSEKFHTNAFASIEELLASDIDAVYIATPHPTHKDFTLQALQQNKAVLCEKPFALNFSEASEMVALARQKNLFLMEAMWTRCFPAIRAIRQIIQSGELGEILSIESEFGYALKSDDAWVMKKELAGGSFLDIGVYCVSFTQMLAPSEIEKIEAKAEITPSGIDLSARWEIQFKNGVKAKGASCISKPLKNSARIAGTKGNILVPNFWHPEKFFLNNQEVKFPFEGQGFQFEIEEVSNCLREKKTESSLMPLQDSISTLQWMDQIRNTW